MSYVPQTTFAGGVNPMEAGLSIKNLVHWISTTGPKTAKDIKDKFQAQEHTVRRRLQALEASGELQRNVDKIGGRAVASLWSATDTPAAGGCTHRCNQGRNCTCRTTVTDWSAA